MRDRMLSWSSSRRVGLAALLGLLLGPACAAMAHTTNTTFVILNETGYHPAQIHVKFLGAEIVATGTPQTYGNGNLLETGASTASRSYSLFDMLGTVPSTPYASTPVPTFALNAFQGGARIYFSIGQPLSSTTTPNAGMAGSADYHVPYQYVEPAIAGGDTDTGNIDVSYVDFVGIPTEIAARNADGSLYVYPTGKNPQTSASGTTMFDHLIAANVPLSAIAPATIGGTARIASPSLGGVTGYHDWSTLSSYLEATWNTPSNTVHIASYVVPSGKPLADVHFGYSGGGVATDPYGPEFLLQQDYAFTAEFTSNLNPNGTNPRVPLLEGIAGVKLTGSGGPYGATTGTGDFDIYIEESDLNAQTGVYGNNPAYTVDWIAHPGGAMAFPKSTGIVNDLTGRVVGDLLAGMTFGWAGSATQIAPHATATNTVLPDVFTEPRIGDLGTGKYFYLLSLQDSPADLAKWFGSGISSTPDYYDTYGSAFAADTTAYTMPFGDRLQGSLTPSIWWEVSSFGEQNGYLEIKLLPGAYTVPEPASAAAMAGAALTFAALARRRARDHG